MNLVIKYNFERTYKVILQEQLDKHGLDYDFTSAGCIKLASKITEQQYNCLIESLNHYGIDIIDNQKAIIVQKIKHIVREMLNKDNGMPLIKISTYLSECLNENYRTISAIFSDVCYMSIESFIIFHKIEIVKQLLLRENLSLTEISHKLQYSSVAHLSNQFKNLTGFSPTTFQKITINKRLQLN